MRPYPLATPLMMCAKNVNIYINLLKLCIEYCRPTLSFRTQCIILFVINIPDFQYNTKLGVLFTCHIQGMLQARGGATILRVGGTNITASEASRKIFGVVPPTYAILGVQQIQREAYRESIGQRCYNILLVVLVQFLPVFKYFSNT